MPAKYIFNPAYQLRIDSKRVLVITDLSFQEGSVITFVHPIYALILNSFDGKTEIAKIEQRISSLLSVPMDQLHSILSKLIDNPEDVYIKFDGVISTFPPHIITENKKNRERTRLDENSFMLDKPLDHKTRRLFYPLTLLLCPTLSCYTNCIYCYANKQHKYENMPVERWVEIVRQAKVCGITEIDVTGGEFFTFRGWQKIATALVEDGYMPDISTKVPLSKKTIDDIVKSGLKTLQFSLDTLNPKIAAKTLQVSQDYIGKIVESIKYADKVGLRVILKPTFCKFTCSVENLQSILEFASTLLNIKRVVVSIIGYSCYKTELNYLQIKPDIQSINSIRQCIARNSDRYDFPIYDDTFIYLSSDMHNSKSFSERANCTANVEGFVILPDGTATICEELYWIKEFIIGNAKEQDVLEIWQSERALKLWNLTKEDVPEESACHKCDSFDSCHKVKGVCWKMAIKVYGISNPYFPDPRCPKAPAPFFLQLL